MAESKQGMTQVQTLTVNASMKRASQRPVSPIVVCVNPQDLGYESLLGTAGGGPG